MVLVKHYRLHPDSSDVDSKSIRYQYYHPDVYDEFVREDEETNKENTFVRMGLKTEVVDDARDEKPSASAKMTVVSDEDNAEALRLKQEKEAAKAKEKQEKEAAKAKEKQEKEAAKLAKAAGKADTKKTDAVDNTGTVDNTGNPDENII